MRTFLTGESPKYAQQWEVYNQEQRKHGLHELSESSCMHPDRKRSAFKALSKRVENKSHFAL